MTRPITITGGRVLAGPALEETALRLEGGRIAGFAGGGDGIHIDARGLLVLPALVDIHGDAFERALMPRDGVFFPTEAAVLDTDRQLAANGIATAYHALTLSWEPGLRSVSAAGQVIDALAALERRLTVENRVQLRWETFAFEARPLITRALAGALRPSLAFNDHTSMSMLRDRTTLSSRDRTLAPANTLTRDDPMLLARSAALAKRSGLTAEGYRDLILSVWERRPEIDRVTEEVAAEARAAGAPLLSHDDSTPEMRDWFGALGSRIAEFPMQADTAAHARRRGEDVVLGSPNALRGGSHLGLVSAAEMVEQGICTILASDYHYPAMLGAAHRLVQDGRGSLADMWALVSANPARASGLHDRGRIAEGLRADIVLVDWPVAGPPAIRATISAGRIAYLAGDLLP